MPVVGESLATRTVPFKETIPKDEKCSAAALVQFLLDISRACWPQTTARRASAWILLAWFFAPITRIVLLAENSKRTNSEKGSQPAR